MASRILLADDSITIQKVVNLTFADEGIEVIAVSNGEMAQRRLSEVNPDLVLADIFMPGKNGYELCEYIKQSPQFRHIPVVLLVGAFEPFDPSEARRVQADHHLTKPFESRTLVDTVRNLIRKGGGSTGPLSSPTPAESERSAQSLPETRPLTPPFNIDLSAMTDQPVGPNAQVDSGASGQQAPAAEPQPAAPSLEEDFGFDFRTLTQTDEVSESDAAVRPATEAESSDGFDFAIPESTAPAISAGEGVPAPETPGRGRAVPSAFGSVAQDVLLDFDAVEAPAAPPSDTAEFFDVEASASASENFATGFDFAPEMVEAQIVEAPPASTSQTPPVAAAGDLESLDEMGFSFSELTEVEAAASTLLGAEEPLGDLLMDDGAEAEVTSDVFAEELPSGFELHKTNEFVAHELPHGSNGGGPAFDTNSAQAEFFTSGAPPVEPSLEDLAEEDSTGGEKLDAVFTSSEMWSREEARFAPIDVEAVAVDEPAPAIADVRDFDEPETGFAFQPADEVEAVPEEQIFSAIDQQPGSAPAGQIAAGTGSLPPEVIDEIVRRVVAQLGDTVVREIAWEVVPDCVERVVETLTRDSLSKRV